MAAILTLSIAAGGPEVMAEALRELAGRIDRDEIGPEMEGQTTETCTVCGDTASISWSIDTLEDEDEAEGETPMVIDTPFGRISVIPLAAVPQG